MSEFSLNEHESKVNLWLEGEKLHPCFFL